MSEIPGLSNYIGNAYNARDGNCLGQSVFVLTYDKGTTVQWGSQGQVGIPDQIAASTATVHYSLSESLVLKETADYDRSFSASVAADYTGVTYSGSVSSSLLYHGSLFTSTSHTYALNFYLQKVLTFERLGSVSADDLDDDFVAAIKGLSGQDQDAYFSFFDNYGTHYVDAGALGGTVVMQTSIEDSLYESYSASEINAQIAVGYNGLVASGNLDISAAYSASEFLSQNRSSIQIILSVLGGLYTADEPISQWVDSIYDTPSLLMNVPNSPSLTTLKAISDLAGTAGADEKVADNIKQYLPQYVSEYKALDGLLSSPAGIVANLVYSGAAGNGFILATIRETANGDRGSCSAYASESANPTTLRGLASQHYYTNADTWVPYASLMMPAPSDNKAAISDATTSGDPSVALSFVGLGDANDPAMGPWDELNFGDDYLAASDGFVVAYVDWNGDDGSRGYVQGVLNPGTDDEVVAAAASQHYWSRGNTYVPSNSFCLPIRHGTSYAVKYTGTAGNPMAKAYFTSLPDTLTFPEGFSSRTAGWTYQAETDGFLIAYLSAPTDGGRGYVNLYSYPDTAELTKLGNLASTSVHYYAYHNTWVPYNTATIPVSKHAFYKAEFVQTNPDAKIVLKWIPLMVAS